MNLDLLEVTLVLMTPLLLLIVLYKIYSKSKLIEYFWFNLPLKDDELISCVKGLTDVGLIENSDVDISIGKTFIKKLS